MKQLLILTLIFLSACTTGRRYELDEKWRPLETVEEGTDKLLEDGMTTTIGKHCYVPDLKQWKKDYPEGSPFEEAILLHEQAHAKRQLDTGLYRWLSRYVVDKQFRWEEEKIGYELQIRCLYKNGFAIDAHVFAMIMSQEYKSLDGRMVSYAEARQWLDGLLAKLRQGQ